MCKSKAAGTSTSELGYHLQTKILTSLSFLRTLPNVIKAPTEQLHHSHVDLVGHYVLRQARDACTVGLLLLVWFNNSTRFQIYRVTRPYSSCPFLCALVQNYTLYWKISRVCCPLYCYECAARVTMPTATNKWYFFRYSLVGASLSEPHTSGTALWKYVCNVLVCLRPYTVNFNCTFKYFPKIERPRP